MLDPVSMECMTIVVVGAMDIVENLHCFFIRITRHGLGWKSPSLLEKVQKWTVVENLNDANLVFIRAHQPTSGSMIAHIICASDRSNSDSLAAVMSPCSKNTQYNRGEWGNLLLVLSHSQLANAF